MKKILSILVLPLLIAACDSRDNVFECLPPDEVPTAECLAEAMLEVCGIFSCSSANADVSVRIPNCADVNCETIECDEVRYGIDDKTVTTGPGTLTDLHIGDSGGPAGIINVDGQDQEFECILFQQ